MLIPTVLEKSQFGERAYDIYSRLPDDHRISADRSMMSLDRDQSFSDSSPASFPSNSEITKKDINLYINSPGGSGDRRPCIIRAP